MESADNGKELTSFENICNILGDLWINYRNDSDFIDFVEYNDIGLPLAFFIDTNLAECNEVSKGYIVETWRLFLEALEVEDQGWNSLQEIFHSFKEKK